MSNIKLDGIDIDTYSELKQMLLEQGFDQTKQYTVPEASALYRLVTRCCVSGIVDYANALNLPEETRLTLKDIGQLTINQEGHDLFCKATGLSGPDGEDGYVYGGIDIPDGKGGERESNNDASYAETFIHQKNGHGKVTNFTVSSNFKLDVQVDTNTDLELTNIKTGGDINIHISSANLVQAGAGANEKISKQDAIKTDKKVHISIDTCKRAEFGICADTIEVDQVSTCDEFYLHAVEYDKITYRQSTCNHTYIYVPKGTKFKLTNEVSDSKVDCDQSLTDENAVKEIKIQQVSTGVVHIKEEKE